MSATTDPDRRARLAVAKLQGLLSSNFPDTPSPSGTVSLGSGAAVVCDDRAFVLIEDRPDRGLGAGIAWAGRHGARRLDLLVATSSGTLARRAAEFDFDIHVWEIDGRNVVPAAPAPLSPEPMAVDDHLAFTPVIEEAGADVVVEHGVVGGEVRGLEVCRAVTDPHTGVHRLEVGVGAHDREAFALIHGDTPTVDSLRRIVEVVSRHRAPGADPHPLNRLAAERELRARVLDDPALIGLGSLVAASPAEPRPNVKDPVPCVAVGRDADGRRTVVVFSTGIDLDLVPFAADARLFAGGESDPLLLVVPERDASPVTMRIAALLRRPASVRGL